MGVGRHPKGGGVSRVVLEVPPSVIKKEFIRIFRKRFCLFIGPFGMRTLVFRNEAREVPQVIEVIQFKVASWLVADEKFKGIGVCKVINVGKRWDALVG